jgi:hypothetical protein
LFLTLVVALVQTPALVAAEPNLDGVYLAKGFNPDGTEYSGLVEIARHGQSFFVRWISVEVSPDAVLLTPVWVGLGIVTEGTFAVSYHSANRAGVVVYRIESDGQRLDGHWAVTGDDGTVYPETLTKVPGHLPEPENLELPENHVPQKPKTPVRDGRTLAL